MTEITDEMLVDLYREYSEETWAAGWMSGVEKDKELAESFTEWLRGKTTRSREFVYYEEAALRTLRNCWEIAHGRASNVS